MLSQTHTNDRRQAMRHQHYSTQSLKRSVITNANTSSIWVYLGFRWTTKATGGSHGNSGRFVQYVRCPLTYSDRSDMRAEPKHPIPCDTARPTGTYMHQQIWDFQPVKSREVFSLTVLKPNRIFPITNLSDNSFF